MSLLQKVKDVYRSLPPWVTAPVRCVPNDLLFGKSYRQCVPQVTMDYLGTNLKSVLDYARVHTVWGREHIPEFIRTEDARKIVDDLPCVSTDEVAAEPQRFISDEATDVNSYTTTTGGSGRHPTMIRLSNVSFGVEWKHMLAIWQQGGYCRQKDVKVTFRGYHLKPGELVRRDPVYNELSVDPFQLNDANFPQLLAAITSKGVTCLHGYPSLVKMFMERLKAMEEKFPVRQIMLGSEGASVALKRELAEFFGAKVISWYGLSEKVILAYDADATGRFMNFSSYGYPRVVDVDADGMGELVGTSFVNFAMPLINYRTGDSGRIVEEDGRQIIENLQGRWGKDFVYRSKNSRIPTAAINLHGSVQQKIIFYQLIQNEYGKMLVKVLPRTEWKSQSEVVRQEILAEMAERLKGFEIDCQIVSDETAFERSVRGKLIMLVQNLKT